MRSHVFEIVDPRAGGASFKPRNSRRKGGALKLMHMTERVHELMTVTKLLIVFDVYDDEPEALASFVGETLRIVERQPSLCNRIH